MNNILLQLKIKQRLNKLSSLDYDNLECWMVAEAFNKAQMDWIRRQRKGTNIMREGDEQSTMKIDDLQTLLETKDVSVTDKGIFFETTLALPDNYLAWKRISVKACHGECSDRTTKIWLVEEADINEILSDNNSKPSFDWAETVGTLVGNKLRIYTNNEFNITDVNLMYYRKPRAVHFANCYDPSSNSFPSIEVTCELKEDVIELIIDEAAAILAGDIESQLQIQRNNQSSEKNT